MVISEAQTWLTGHFSKNNRSPAHCSNKIVPKTIFRMHNGPKPLIQCTIDQKICSNPNFRIIIPIYNNKANSLP